MRTLVHRAALLAFVAVALLGGWIALAPAPANADGGTNTFNSGNWDPQIRPAGESGNACTNTRSYAANGGSNSVVFRTTTNTSACSLSGGRNPANANWPRYEIKLASASGQHGSTSAIPGADITYVSGLASGTGSWRNVAGTTYNYRSVGISGALDSGQIGFDGSANDISATFTVPVTHVGTAYLRFTLVGQPLGIFMTHEHVELAYADPHVAAVPLAVPQSSGGTLATGELTAATWTYASSGASQRARIFLRDDWHSNTYTSTETNVARSIFDSATIKITSDAAGATVISGAKISSDSAGGTALAACTENSPGNTCTVTSANFPQDTQATPKTQPLDIHFSVPASHSGTAYLFVATAQSGKTARSFALQYDPPADQVSRAMAAAKHAYALPLVDDGQGGLRVCTADEAGSGAGSLAACASPSAQQGAPLGFAAALMRGNRHPADWSASSSSGQVEYGEITQLRISATGATVHHRTLCPRAAPTHPVYQPAAQTDPASCTISSTALRHFQSGLPRQPIRPLPLALIPTAASGRVTVEYTIAGTNPPETISRNLDFTAADGSPELAAAVFLDWTDPGSDYEAGRPEALFTIGRKDSRPDAPPAPPSALPGGLAPAAFADIAGADLSISQGTIAFGDETCTAAAGGCTVALTAAQLRGAADAADPVGELRAAYRIPLDAAGPTTLTVRARPAAGAAVGGMLAIEHPAVSAPAAFAGLPADADAIIAPGGPAVELAAGFTIAVAAADREWSCLQIDPSFYILQDNGFANSSCPRSHSLAVSRSASGRGSSTTAAWLDDASYLALSGPATFENGTKRLQLGGANPFNQLRCGLALSHGLASAGPRDLACWVADAQGYAPKILIDPDAAGAQLRFAASLAPAQGKRFHVFAGVNALRPGDRQANAAAFVLNGPAGDGAFFLAGPAAFTIAPVQQVASATLQRKDGATAPVRTGQPADLSLAILNANGQPAEPAAISSITLIAEQGKLRAGVSVTQLVEQGSRRITTDPDTFCDGQNACTIPLADDDPDVGNDLASVARTNPRFVAAIPVQLYGVDNAGTVEVSAAIVATDGAEPILAGPLAVEFAGPASSLALGGQLQRVNAFNTVGDDPATTAVETGADQVDAGDPLDRIMIAVSAADADGRTAAVPRNLPSPRVADPDGRTVGTGLSITLNDCNAARTMCNYVIDVNTPASDPLPSGVYTLTASIGAAGEASARFGVAGPPAAIQFAPDPVPGLGRTFSVQIDLADAAGEPVADGTPVAISVRPRGDAIPAISRISPASQPAENGSVTARFVVIGREISIISARAGQASALRVVNALQAAEPGAAIAAQTLTSTQPGNFAHYRGAQPATAASLLEQIETAAIYLWNGKRWLFYATAAGTQIPGSLDFTVHPNDILWLAP